MKKYELNADKKKVNKFSAKCEKKRESKCTKEMESARMCACTRDEVTGCRQRWRWRRWWQNIQHTYTNEQTNRTTDRKKNVNYNGHPTVSSCVAQANSRHTKQESGFTCDHQATEKQRCSAQSNAVLVSYNNTHRKQHTNSRFLYYTYECFDILFGT